MSSLLHVTCDCGCDNRVPPDRRGKWTSCAACGKELAVPEDAPALVTDSDPPATASPTRATKRARSPFEEDQGTTDFSARFRNYTAAAYEGASAEHCSRCGRELRGDWDRLESSSGILCYICANQGSAGTPERLKHIVDAPDVPRRPRERIDRADTLRYRQTSARRRFKSLALKAIVVAIALLFFGAVYLLENVDIQVPILEGDWSLARSPSVGDVNNLALIPWVLYQAWVLLSTSAGVFVGAFMSLLFTSALTKEQIVRNIFSALSLSMPFAAIKILGLIMLPLFGNDAARAALITVIISALQAMALVYIVYELLDESPWHGMYFIMFFVAFAFSTPYLNGFVFQHLQNF